MAGTAVANAGSIPAFERQDLDSICHRLAFELEQMAGKRLLVTGGAGFLGYYLIRAVLHYNARAKAPIELTVVDNYLRGEPPWLKGLSSPWLRLVTHDVTVPLPADLGSFELIAHAASIASPTFYRSHPIETMDANVRGLRRLLDRCVERADGELEGLLFFSSSEVYGDPTADSIPTQESYPGRVSCTGPRACYDESKRYGETLCINFHQQYGLPIKIVRPFNNYGPGLKITDRRLLADFARCVLAGDDIVMHSDGSPTRTFCYIADAVVGYYKALTRGRAGEAYNIGADRPEISVRAIAQEVASVARELFGYSGRVIQRPSDDRDYLIDNPQRRCPAIDKARSELAFEPEVSLRDGLRRMLLWYRQHPSAIEA